MRGDVSEVPLAEVVRDLFFDRRDGVLTVEGGGRSDQIYFDRGEVFYCKTDAPEARLDRLLVKWGLVAPEDVAGLVQRAGQDVRAALVREGVFADTAAFDDFMTKIVRERMADAFALPAAAWSFGDKDVRALQSLAFSVTTPNVILEGVRRMADVDSLLHALVDDDSALHPNAEPLVPMQSLELGPAEGYVLAQVNGVVRPSAIVRTSPMSEADTIRLLYGLLVIDVLRHPAYAGYRFYLGHLARRTSESQERDAADRDRILAEYERVRAVDVFQIAPEEDRADPERHRAALKRHQEAWKPDSFSPELARELRDQLTLIAGRAGEALLALMERDHRSSAAAVPAEGGAVREGGTVRLEFAKSEAQALQEEVEVEARRHFERGMESYRSKDYHTAVQFLREAVRRHETAVYQECLGDALAQNPHWRRRAEEAYQRASELDRFSAELPLKLGRLYARSGMLGRARECFERAIKAQPDHEEARQALRELRRR